MAEEKENVVLLTIEEKKMEINRLLSIIAQRNPVLTEDQANFLEKAQLYGEDEEWYKSRLENVANIIDDYNLVIRELKEIYEITKCEEEYAYEISLFEEFQSYLEGVEESLKKQKGYKLSKEDKKLIKEAKEILKRGDVEGENLLNMRNILTRLKFLKADIERPYFKEKSPYFKKNSKAKKVIGKIVAAPGVAIDTVAAVGGGILKTAGDLVIAVGDGVVKPFATVARKGVEEDMEKANNLPDKVVAATETITAGGLGTIVALPFLAAAGILKGSGFLVRLAASVVSLPFNLVGNLIAMQGEKEKEEYEYEM